MFAEIVNDRKSSTLLDVIKKNIHPETFIISDGWKGYFKLNESDYNHDWVNHSKNFLKPDDKLIHTQTIERQWRSLKESVPKSLNIDGVSFLIEYLYRTKYHTKDTFGLNFSITLKHIAEFHEKLNSKDENDDNN